MNTPQANRTVEKAILEKREKIVEKYFGKSPQGDNIKEKEIDNGERNTGLSRGTGESHPGRTSAESSNLSEREQAGRVRAENAGGTGGLRGREGGGSEEVRGEPHNERDSGLHSVASSDKGSDSGDRDRLEPSDVRLSKKADSGDDSPAVRFDDNLRAIEGLKILEEEHRQATPQEQKVLARYSGFGDSAFSEAFREHTYQDTAWTRRGAKLKAITTPEEYDAILKSRLNAFYTTPETISFMWKALEKFGVGKLKNPRVLEPSAGSGRFLGYQPEEMAKKSERVAVELDSLTGRILKQLYPKAETYVMGFEKAPIQKESIDVAISNVPFGNYPVHDPSFTKDRKRMTRSIHNYFFAKTLEELRPGGVLAFITSHQTLDAPSHKPVREALATEADLIGAIRLPNNAFPDTKVVTDIIFMKKRMEGEPAADKSWVDTGKVNYRWKTSYGGNMEANLDVNKYFIQHPENVLGRPSGDGDMNPRHAYGEGEYTVHGNALSMEENLDKVFKKLPSDIIIEAPRREKSTAIRSVGDGINEGQHVVRDDKLYVKRGGALVTPNYSKAEETKVRAMAAIRDAAKEVVNIQVRDGGDIELAPAQEKLRNLYQEYVLEHGALSAPENTGMISGDPDAPFLRALEHNEIVRKPPEDQTDSDKHLIQVLAGKAKVKKEDIEKLRMPIFSYRVIHGMAEKQATNSVDAMFQTLNETGRLDFDKMASKIGKNRDDVIKELADQRLIFKSPVGGWETAELYLAGDVRGKLGVAERAASARPKAYNANVDALKAVQPADIPAGQIGVKLGAPWIDGKYVNQFVKELLEPREERVRYRWNRENEKDKSEYFRYNDITGEWDYINKVRVDDPFKNNEKWGTQRMNAVQIIDRVLNGKLIEVNDKDANDRPIRNATETIAAQEKAAAIQNEFEKWLWNDPDRAQTLVKFYNETYNNFRPPIFNGSHLVCPGMSEKWHRQLHPHQKDAIWRGISTPNEILAHEVGFGKSAVMIATAMKQRQLGISNKNMFVVPKATHAQFKDQFLDIYPFAKILYPGEEDFTPAKRAEFISRAVTGDYDAIIVSDSQYRKIPVRPETEQKFIRQEMDTIIEAINATEDKQSQKELQKTLERAKVRLEDAVARGKERNDNTVFFEDIGVDRLYVDEADNFKNLRFATKMGRIKGLPNSDSERAFDMYEKIRYMQSRPGTGVIFATGTPVANTIAEMYTNMRYLQEPLLEEKRMKHFDAWAATFGQTTESLEQTPTGAYKLTQRFAKFKNAPELSNMWQNVADIRVADEVPEMVAQRPRIVDKDGKARRTVISTAPDQALIDYMAELAERADNLKNVDPTEDNMLKISSDARKASLDMRLVKGDAPFNPEGKVTKACEEITKIWKETKPDKGTQLVFLDMGTPKAKEKVEEEKATDENEPEETVEEMSVLKDVYTNIKNQLVHNGIPEDEISFIHNAKNDKQKKALFEKVNKGEIRVLIGSTNKLGTGVNVQERAAALHHLDAPWRPRDIEQREGRIIRQGNIVYGPKRDTNGKIIDPGKGVKIFTYVTERSFDAYMWQAIEAKSKAIKAIMRRSAPPRAIEDIDSFTMSASEAKAIASGNPDVMRSVELKNSVNKLQMIRSSWVESRVRAATQLKILPEQIKNEHESIAKMEKDALKAKKDEAKFGITINGKYYNERPVAGKAIIEALKKAFSDGSEIGEYRGFKIKALNQGPQAGYKIILFNPETKYEYPTQNIMEQDLTEAGVVARIDNKVNNIPLDLEEFKSRTKKHEASLKSYEQQAEAPFEQEERLYRLQKELTFLEKKLQGEKVEEVPPSENYTEPTDDEMETPPGYSFSSRSDEEKPEDGHDLPVAATVTPALEIKEVSNPKPIVNADAETKEKEHEEKTGEKSEPAQEPEPETKPEPLTIERKTKKTKKEGDWVHGAEIFAAIPGEPIGWYKPDEKLEHAEATMFEDEDGNYYVVRENGERVEDPKTQSALFEDMASAKEAFKNDQFRRKMAEKKERMELKDTTKFPELDTRILEVRPPKKEGDYWEIYAALNASRGNEGESTRVFQYAEPPSLSLIKGDIKEKVDEYAKEEADIKEEGKELKTELSDLKDKLADTTKEHGAESKEVSEVKKEITETEKDIEKFNRKYGEQETKPEEKPAPAPVVYGHQSYQLPHEAVKYIRAIKNKNKKAYAEKYAGWLAHGSKENEEPEHGELSAMGAQAVRMELYKLMREVVDKQQHKKTPYEMGQDAYRRGLKAAINDVDFFDAYMTGKAVGSNLPELQEWNRGWASAAAPDQPLPDKKEIWQLPLSEFEKEHQPYEITQSQWIDMQKAERRRLGQDEKSGTQFAPYQDYKSYHEESVKEAVKSGKMVADDVLHDYPELQHKATFEKVEVIKIRPKVLDTKPPYPGMKLLTKEIEDKLPKLYATEKTPIEDKTIIAKYFHPMGDLTYYAVEYDPKEKEFFGLTVLNGEKEWGYFSLEHLANLNISGLGIERDKWWKPVKVKDMPENEMGYVDYGKKAVKKALKEGKPVPESVLDDYPKLKHKTEAHAPKSPTGPAKTLRLNIKEIDDYETALYITEHRKPVGAMTDGKTVAIAPEVAKVRKLLHETSLKARGKRRSSKVDIEVPHKYLTEKLKFAIRYGMEIHKNEEHSKVTPFENRLNAAYAEAVANIFTNIEGEKSERKKEPLKAGKIELTAKGAPRVSELKRIEEERSPRARAIDESRPNSTTYDKQDPRTIRWIAHPGQSDVSGIDTKDKVVYHNKNVSIREVPTKYKKERAKTLKGGRAAGAGVRGVDLGAGVVQEGRKRHIK